MGRPEVEDNGITFAIDEATVLPKLEQACAIRSRPEECSRGRNRFVFVGGEEFCSPHDLAVTVEQVTAILERPYWRPQPQYLVQELPLPGLQRDDFKPEQGRRANTLAHAGYFFRLVLPASHMRCPEPS